MEPDRYIDLIQKIVVSVVGLYRIILDTPKVWATLGKGWTLFSEFLRNLEPEDVREDAPVNTIVPLNGTLIAAGGRAVLTSSMYAYETVPVGLPSDGYTAHKYRQNSNAYYYWQGATDTPLPLRFS